MKQIPLALLVWGCAADQVPESDDTGHDSSGADSSGAECIPLIEVSATPDPNCMPAEGDYRPQDPETGDAWPACITDDGAYHLISDTPSSIARVQAFDDLMAQLRVEPVTTAAFTEARMLYAMDEGLESRVVRREDLHFPAIPEADWDPGVDPDKQCTVNANIDQYPKRCAGPARIAPLLNEAFAAGQTGEGDSAVHVARIEAALLWFLHLSVYKEANTCLLTAKDCDSSWAYYTGGVDRSGGIGLAAQIRELSERGHQRIWDGFSAVRCWRDLYPIEDYPSIDDVDANGQALLQTAYDQLDRALWYGWAQLVRDRIDQYGQSCGSDAQAHQAFLSIAGPVLSEQAERLDPAAAAPLPELWTQSDPSAEQLQAAADTIDTLFGCP